MDQSFLESDFPVMFLAVLCRIQIIPRDFFVFYRFQRRPLTVPAMIHRMRSNVENDSITLTYQGVNRLARYMNRQHIVYKNYLASADIQYSTIHPKD